MIDGNPFRIQRIMRTLCKFDKNPGKADTV